MSVSTFACYVWLHPSERLTAEKAFVALTLFRALQRPLTKLPYVLFSLVQVSVSLRRVDEFLAKEELADYVTHSERFLRRVFPKLVFHHHFFSASTKSSPSLKLKTIGTRSKSRTQVSLGRRLRTA